MLIPLRIDRTTKPPLGTPLRSDGHWSVQGLVGGWAYNEGAGSNVFDGIAGGRAQLLGGAALTPTGVSFTSAASSYIHLPNVIAMVAPFSIVALVSIDTLAGAKAIFSTGQTTSVGNVQLLEIEATTGIPFTRTNQAGTWTNLAYGPRAIALNQPTLVSAVHASNNNRICYVNETAGVANTQTSTPSGCNTSNVGALVRNTTAEYFQGTQHLTLAYNRALSPAEIASLSANPWQIYEPEVVWVEVGAGGPSAVYSDISLKWDQFQIVSSDLSVKWDLLNSVQSDLSIKFDTLNTVFADLAIPWDVYASVNGDLTIVFDTRNTIASDLQILWDSAGTVFSDLTVKWDLGDVSGRIRIIGSSFRRFIG